MDEQELARLKDNLRGAIDAMRSELIDLSLTIHDNPELGHNEFQASALLQGFLKSRHFQVESGTAGFATAFRASYGSSGPVIAFVAEYDALPKIGHACGHNIIGVASAAAAVASRLIVDGVGGKVAVIGTPAEELIGGKVPMIERGAFEGVDAAMMIHPGVRDTALSTALACVTLEVEFFGKAAHAAARPEDGINALDAMVISYNALNALRQHIRSRARFHGIITDGGEAANVVPAHTAGNFIVRADTMQYLEGLKERVLNCFRAGALATGARMEHRWAEVCYEPLRSSQTLAELYTRNMDALGRKVHAPNPERGLGSTDMGNVSQVMPAIHPSVAIAPTNVLAHSPEFAEAAASEPAHQGLLDGAKALAMTAADLLCVPENLARAKEEFARG